MNFTVARKLRQVGQQSHFFKEDLKVFNMGYFSDYFLEKCCFFSLAFSLPCFMFYYNL